jgi:hypothetical protein
MDRMTTQHSIHAVSARPLAAGPPTALLLRLYSLIPGAAALGKRRSSAPPDTKVTAPQNDGAGRGQEAIAA